MDDQMPVRDLIIHCSPTTGNDPIIAIEYRQLQGNGLARLSPYRKNTIQQKGAPKRNAFFDR